MDKYYTPEISEFHIGFEFESDYSGDGWDKGCYNENYINLFNIKHKIELNQIRIKYLDREDIESLGWVVGHHVNIWADDDDIIEGYSLDRNDTDSYVMFYDTETCTLGIYLQRIYNEVSGNWTSHVMFSGHIHNKSELIKLMKQIGI